MKRFHPNRLLNTLRSTAKTILALAALASVCPAALAGKVGGDCTFNGKQLWGKVQFVTAFPDIKVQVVSSFPDVKVQKVTAFADSCGKWQEVDAFPDIKARIVSSFPDVTIQYVDSFPGVP